MTAPGNAPDAAPRPVATGNWQEVKAAFARVFDLPAADRPAALAGFSTELRAEVAALLDAHESDLASSGPTIESARAGAAGSGVEQHPGEMIGRYRLLERIGEGGFGVVFVAEQTEPIRRRVAIKIVKLGMDTAAVVARFEAERQALAMMEHPGIARVLDAGTTATGRPYFVMELVKGRPIHEYCEGEGLSVRQRLELMVEVCRAVQHAHQKGIIHRDLKPSNVLVTMSDGRPAPKVIDFGIAKATHGHLTDRTVYTEFRQFIGTPEYMSPEQAAGSLDIDTRTDVYSLGVILYQLLTGHTPIDQTRLKSAAFDEMRRMIREEEPPRPSTRLSAATRQPSGVSAQSSVVPRTRVKDVRGELDWIVMRAIEKAPSRRYDSPDRLAEDLTRYLRGEPVAAGPPTVAYRVRKFVSRRRGLVAGAGLMVLAAGVGVAGLGTGLVRASRERDDAIKARGEADAARLATETEARKYRAASDFLRGMLSSAGPQGQTGRELTVREMLDAGAADIESGSLSKQPEVEATARLAIGLTYEYLGVFDRAELHLQRARELRTSISGPEHVDVAECLVALGRMRNNNNQSVEAEALVGEAVRIYRKSAPQHPDLWAALSLLGGVQASNSKVELGRATEQEALALAIATHGEESREVADMRLSVATQSHSTTFDPAEAERALEMFRKSFGPKHPSTAVATLSVGSSYHLQRKYDLAEERYREAMEISQETFGPTSPAAIDALFRLAWVADSRKDFAAAEARWRDVVERSRICYGRVSNPVAVRLNRLAISIQKAGRHDAAEPVFREALSVYDPPHGLAPDLTLAMILSNLGVYHEQRGEFTALEALARRLMSIDESVLSADDWSRAQAQGYLGVCLGARGEFVTGETALLESFEKLSAHPGTKNFDFPFQAAVRLRELYRAWNAAEPSAERAASAERWRATAADLREKLKARGMIFRDR